MEFDFPYLNNGDVRNGLFTIVDGDRGDFHALNNNYMLEQIEHCLDLDNRDEDDQHDEWKNSEEFDKQYQVVMKHEPEMLDGFWRRLTNETIATLTKIVMRPDLFHQYPDHFHVIREMAVEQMEEFLPDAYSDTIDDLPDNDSD